MWDGDTDEDWTNGDNWVGGSAPGGSDLVEFPGTATGFDVNLEGSGQNHNSMTISGSTGYTFTNGTLDITEASGIDVQAAAVTHTFECNVTDTEGAIFEVGLNIGSGATLQVHGMVTGDVSVIKSGVGTLILTNNNPFTGDTMIFGGTFSIPTSFKLGTNGSSVTIDGATMEITQPDETFESAILLGNGGGTVDVAATYSANLTRPVTGTGKLTKRGLGELAMVSSNTYLGGFRIEEGSLRFDDDGIFGNGISPIELAGGTLRVVSDVVSSNFFGITAPTTISNDGGNLEITGGIAGNPTGTLIKAGSGILTLSTPNFIPGGTVISGGTILANNSVGSAFGTGSVTVANGGTLGGTGVISRTVTFESGGTMAPGVSPGVLTVGTVVYTNGSTNLFELAGTNAGVDHDQLIVTNTALLDGSLFLTHTNGFFATLGDLFEIIVANQVTGTFDSVIFPETNTDWAIIYETNKVIAAKSPHPFNHDYECWPGRQ